jgi:glutathione S-transferase
MSSRNQSRQVVLFGYESSAFTWKVRLALRLKQIPYTFVTVESMMPRPKLREAFNLTYRRIPVLAIGRDVYCDTSLICDALEHYYPESEGHPSLFPATADGRDQSSIMRGFAAYWVGAPLYRATCAVMPADIWRTSFGTDRGGLIGHAIDADKLAKKIPEGMWKLDHHLSMLERLFQPDSENRPWLFSTHKPSLADLALYAQLWWCREISAGNLMENLTGGGTPDATHPGIGSIFNEQRHPGLMRWFYNFENYLAKLSSTETKDPA